jgi:hypothetical protein
LPDLAAVMRTVYAKRLPGTVQKTTPPPPDGGGSVIR